MRTHASRSIPALSHESSMAQVGAVIQPGFSNEKTRGAELSPVEPRRGTAHPQHSHNIEKEQMFVVGSHSDVEIFFVPEEKLIKVIEIWQVIK